jgi:hypothetical protein
MTCVYIQQAIVYIQQAIVYIQQAIVYIQQAIVTACTAVHGANVSCGLHSVLGLISWVASAAFWEQVTKRVDGY